MATWNIDSSHSGAHFTVRHLMITNVRGEFTGLSGTVDFDPAAPEGAKVTASIEASTVSTRDEKRDGHLKSADFFEVEKHPKLTFTSTSIAKKGDGLALTGDLTIRGTTKSVTFQVEGPTKEEKDPWGNTRIGASATATIDRREFGLTWNSAIESGGVLVGHDVKLTIDVSLVRA
jgi:polyisoprenoid-binding protein YceI